MGVGLLGRGTVGSAFVDEFNATADSIAESLGKRPVISGILRRSEGDFEQILRDSDVVVELMGGLDPARGYVEKALNAGCDVVTANKQLVAHYGEDLARIAGERDVHFRYEAAIAGAVPITPVLKGNLLVTHIDRVMGIVNGTTNFILEEMAKTQSTFEDALAQAQKLGYAEPDPTEDINGKDAAAKMAILARLAFGSSVKFEDVDYWGIESIDPDDLLYAKEFSLSLKLLGIAERQEDSLSVRVFPCFVSDKHPLASVHGPFNAVTIDAPAIELITMSGPGAGARATASIVLNDVVAAVARMPQADYFAVTESLAIDNSGQRSCFYIHLIVADEPGVLANVAEVLAKHDISVESAVQRGLGDQARLMLVTHECDEDGFWEALLDLSKLRVTRSEPRAIRVREQA
ncbi:MAG TPA: homoserine dehydrogenase [Solirubrobacterales bacterium]|nr:homoserine dehydrogenase [Solirubrobacterales bacterium]